MLVQHETATIYKYVAIEKAGCLSSEALRNVAQAGWGFEDAADHTVPPLLHHRSAWEITYISYTSNDTLSG
jgi:hypothetical protein